MSGIFVRKRSSLLTPKCSRYAGVQRKHSFILSGSRTSKTKKCNGDPKLCGSSRFQCPTNAQAKDQQSAVKKQVKRKSENKQHVHGKDTVSKRTAVKTTLESTGKLSELLKIDFDLKISEEIIAELKNDKLALAADKFLASIRRCPPMLGRIEENPPIADGPDNSVPTSLPILGNLETNIAMVQNELKDLKYICMDSKQISEYLYTSYHDLKEEITSQNCDIIQLRQWSLAPHAPYRYAEKPSIKTTDNEIRGIILNLSIIIGIFLYHFLFLLNESNWTE